jgi:predicted amidohydrolase
MKVNRVGPEGDMVYRGRSIVIDPTGQLIAGPASEDQDDILCADLDLEKIRGFRNRRPRLMNRRPEVYKQLSEPLARMENIFMGEPTTHGKPG